MAGHQAIIDCEDHAGNQLKDRYDKLDSVEKRDQWGVIVSRTGTNEYRERYDFINWD